jgi:hypothetical protein
VHICNYAVSIWWSTTYFAYINTIYLTHNLLTYYFYYKYNKDIVPARYLIQVISFPMCSICLEERLQLRNWFQQTTQWAEKWTPAIPSQIAFEIRACVTYGTKIIELRLLEWYWYPDFNLKFRQIERLPSQVVLLLTINITTLLSYWQNNFFANWIIQWLMYVFLDF